MKNLAEKHQANGDNETIDLEKSLIPRKKVKFNYSTRSVIYGDIGTSPLYVFTAIFSTPPTDPRDTMGCLSLIIWSLTIVPLIKYVLIVIRADDHGEGGTFALYSLLARYSGLAIRGETRNDDLTIGNYDAVSIQSHKDTPNFIYRNKKIQGVLLAFVILGASLILGDGLLTPAISVISAVEGMEVQVPSLASGVVPLSCAIIFFLFIGQQYGTDKVSKCFAPIVSLWLFSLAAIGIWNISGDPSVLKAYNPYYAFNYFIRNGSDGFNVLGGVLLCITGVEALYADLGHFNRHAVQISFSFMVYPPLVLAYMGQAARIIEDPTVVSNTFWITLPQTGFIYWFTFILAILATIIASQAMISATYTLIHQAMRLDCFPRVKIIHTSHHHQGQIYIAEINWILMALVLVVIIAFQHSANLTNAYGVAVASVMLITTFLLTTAIQVVWKFHAVVAIAFFLTFGLIDGAFLVSTLQKVPDGGWFTLSFGALLATIMGIWKWGTTLRVEYELKNKTRLDNLFEDHSGTASSENSNVLAENSTANGNETITSATTTSAAITSTTITIRQSQKNQLRLLGSGLKVHRLPGIGMFYQDASLGVPLSFSHFIQHLPAAPETLVFISIRPVAVPYVGEEDRLVVRKVGLYEGIYKVIARYGYMEPISQSRDFIQKLIEAIRAIDPEQTSLKPEAHPEEQVVTYVVSRQQVRPNSGSWFKKTLLKCYVFLSNNSRETHGNWHIPHEDIIDVGMTIPL
ncbi:2005_t:CDS:2 [Ambispora leptoticha]|uniref:2005_t:CDS:1 n=1 Tax=Ambispora leptoticha TaxID=144679 RepID=A0A9N9A9C1_9GLOM|nr:2005_t:CDS:2 [Ambispora leptoticha]